MRRALRRETLDGSSANCCAQLALSAPREFSLLRRLASHASHSFLFSAARIQPSSPLLLRLLSAAGLLSRAHSTGHLNSSSPIGSPSQKSRSLMGPGLALNPSAVVDGKLLLLALACVVAKPFLPCSFCCAASQNLQHRMRLILV